MITLRKKRKGKKKEAVHVLGGGDIEDPGKGK